MGEYIVEAGGYKFIFDLADSELIKKTGVWPHICDGRPYARGTCGEYDKKRLSRVLLGVTDPYIIVDHKDGNTLNNRRSNLRKCTKQQNNFNREVNKTKKLKLPKGVYKRGTRYRATISWNSTNYHLGTFDTIEGAEAAYNKKAEEWHGEFASHLSRGSNE